MNLAVWAERNGVAWVIAYRWFRAGLLPVPAQRVGRLILVNDPAVEESGRGRTLVYARVSSADQRSDLDRRVARVTAWATSQHLSVDKVVAEGGWALNGHRRKFFALLGDPVVTRIVVEHRDRFCWFGSEYVEAALVAQGRELVVVDLAEVDDDLVGDMTEILTSMCARLYGERAAQNGAKRALASTIRACRHRWAFSVHRSRFSSSGRIAGVGSSRPIRPWCCRSRRCMIPAWPRRVSRPRRRSQCGSRSRVAQNTEGTAGQRSKWGRT